MSFFRNIPGWFNGILGWFHGSAARASTDPVRHVIVLMFENHSFDQMLGCFQSIFPNVDGVDPANPRCNKDAAGREYYQHISSDPVVSPDPKHEVEHILNSLKDDNSGFVSEYEKEYLGTPNPTTPEQRQRIMDYFGLNDLPALHALAQNFAICDRWFSSVPGPTWTNRFFAYSGTSKGIVEMPANIGDTDLYLHYDQDTVFDRLYEKGIPWRVYFGDVPNSLVLRHQHLPHNALNYRWMQSFFADVQGPELEFPWFSLIEPSYLKGEQNDDHPPHSTMRAQWLLAEVYNALRKNDQLWKSTLLIVFYDENGGFYDHVPPPTAVPPDQFPFDRLGVRVPALLVSPLVKRQVLSTEFDHTSVLKYLTEKWNLGPLTERVAQAKSFAEAILNSPRDVTPDSIPMPPLDTQTGPSAAVADELAEPLNDNQKALLAFSEHLEQQTTGRVPSLGLLVTKTARLVTGLRAESERAKQRVEQFLEQQKAKANVS